MSAPDLVVYRSADGASFVAARGAPGAPAGLPGAPARACSAACRVYALVFALVLLALGANTARGGAGGAWVLVRRTADAANGTSLVTYESRPLPPGCRAAGTPVAAVAAWGRPAAPRPDKDSCRSPAPRSAPGSGRREQVPRWRQGRTP
jgi:hypothetical protein